MSCIRSPVPRPPLTEAPRAQWSPRKEFRASPPPGKAPRSNPPCRDHALHPCGLGNNGNGTALLIPLPSRACSFANGPGAPPGKIRRLTEKAWRGFPARLPILNPQLASSFRLRHHNPVKPMLRVSRRNIFNQGSRIHCRQVRQDVPIRKVGRELQRRTPAVQPIHA